MLVFVARKYAACVDRAEEKDFCKIPENTFERQIFFKIDLACARFICKK